MVDGRAWCWLLLASLALLAAACVRKTAPPSLPEQAVLEPVRDVPPPAQPERPPSVPSAPPAAAAAETPRPVQPQPLQIPKTVRVGLAVDLEELALPCCEAGFTLRLGSETSGLRVPPGSGQLLIRPSPGAVRAGVFRVQVAALKDELQAHQLAKRLAELVDAVAETVFDPASDLYRVRVGEHNTREEAERLQERLRTLGMEKTWIATEGGWLSEAAFEVEQGGKRRRFVGRWLAVRADGEGFFYDGSLYRGRMLLFLNDRGRLNAINELPFQDYLRGVIPREMGPELYPRLEALKAQTVAARTYTLRNLGEFAGEGYDICATARCQVYGGMAAEHPLSDQAVAETAGEVLVHAGEVVDALYSASCGGHTEDVEVVFPLKGASYLRGVACLERGAEVLSGEVAGKDAFDSVVVGRLLGPYAEGGGDRVAEVEARLLLLARLAELPAAPDRLRSLERREVQRYVLSLFDLKLDPRLREPRAALARLLESPPPEWSAVESGLASLFARPGTPAAGEIDRLLLLLALRTGVLDRYAAHYLTSEGGRLRLRRGSHREDLVLSPTFATLERHGGDLEPARLLLRAGDPIEVYARGDEALAVVATRMAEPVLFPAGSPTWTRFRSAATLSRLVAERYPGFVIEDLEVLERGASGRVGSLRLAGAGGASLIIDGLAIRWTLDLPETQFTVEPSTDEEGRSGWRFRGRGQGHGVGLCQLGAFAMAGRGHDYRDILEHFYNDIEVAHLTTSEASASSSP